MSWRLYVLSFLMLTSASGVTQSPWWTERIARSELASATVLVGKFVGPWKAVKMPVERISGLSGADPSRPWACHSREFKIEGRDGRKISVVIPALAPSAEAPKTPEGRVIVLGRAATKGVIGGWIIVADTGRDPIDRLTLRNSKEGEVTGLLILPYEDAHVPTDGDFESKLTALVRTASPKLPGSYDLICRLLAVANPEWSTRDNALDPVVRAQMTSPASAETTSFAASQKLAALFPKLIKEAPGEYERSRLLELQVRWRIPGGLAPYHRSLRSLLTSRSAYGRPGQLGHGWGPIEDLLIQHAPVEGWVEYPVSDWIEDLNRATNPVLRSYFLRNGGGVMTSGELKRFAMLLLKDDQRLMYEVAVILASQTNTPSHAPKEYGVVDGKLVDYPDLDEHVRYWRKHFKI